MINFAALDKPCPKCNGLGRIENPAWSEFWHQDLFRATGTQEKLMGTAETVLTQPDEPIFFVCKECHGKGKVLTDEGKHLIDFIRFWLNPNYQG